GRDHRADRDDAAVGHRATFAQRERTHQNSSASERLWPVSMSTTTLIPARRTGSPGFWSTRMRTGTRCTTFTQLPLAFCAGRIENSEPVPGLMLCTVPDHTRPG